MFLPTRQRVNRSLRGEIGCWISSRQNRGLHPNLWTRHQRATTGASRRCYSSKPRTFTSDISTLGFFLLAPEYRTFKDPKTATCELP